MFQLVIKLKNFIGLPKALAERRQETFRNQMEQSQREARQAEAFQRAQEQRQSEIEAYQKLREEEAFHRESFLAFQSSPKKVFLSEGFIGLPLLKAEQSGELSLSAIEDLEDLDIEAYTFLRSIIRPFLQEKLEHTSPYKYFQLALKLDPKGTHDNPDFTEANYEVEESLHSRSLASELKDEEGSLNEDFFSSKLKETVSCLEAASLSFENPVVDEVLREELPVSFATQIEAAKKLASISVIHSSSPEKRRLQFEVFLILGEAGDQSTTHVRFVPLQIRVFLNSFASAYLLNRSIIYITKKEEVLRETLTF